MTDEPITPQPPPKPPPAACDGRRLEQLARQSQKTALQSSNLAAAAGNGVVLFTLCVLKELLKQEALACPADLTKITALAGAIANLNASIKLYNPQPFNS